MRFMERILVVSSTDKSHTMLAQFLSSCGVQSQLCRAMAGSEARRALVDGEFDLVLVNTPLPDEFGHELAQLAAGETTQMMHFIKLWERTEESHCNRFFRI